jgi:hypothetical protein
MIGKLNGVMPGADPERLAEGQRVDVRRHLVGELALEELGQPAGELDDLHAADDLAAGVLEDLAVLGGDQAGELVLVALEQLAEAEHHARAAGQRHVAPRGEGAPGGLDRGVDVGRVGQEHLGLLCSRGGIEHGRGARRGPGRLPAADPVLDGSDGGGAHRAHHATPRGPRARDDRLSADIRGKATRVGRPLPRGR